MGSVLLLLQPLELSCVLEEIPAQHYILCFISNIPRAAASCPSRSLGAAGPFAHPVPCSVLGFWIMDWVFSTYLLAEGVECWLLCIKMPSAEAVLWESLVAPLKTKLMSRREQTAACATQRGLRWVLAGGAPGPPASSSPRSLTAGALTSPAIGAALQFQNNF